MPEESFGKCLNFEMCKSKGTLADGLCMNGWDNSMWTAKRRGKPRKSRKKKSPKTKTGNLASDQNTRY